MNHTLTFIILLGLLSGCVRQKKADSSGAETATLQSQTDTPAMVKTALDSLEVAEAGADSLAGAKTPEKESEFITDFKYLPPGFACFTDMFKYNVIDFPGFSKWDILYFKKYTHPVNGYTVSEIHALNYNTCNAYVICFEKGNKKFFVGGEGCGDTDICTDGKADICTEDGAHVVDKIDYWGVPGGDTITPHSFKLLKESQDSLCIKAYNLHFDSAKKYTEYGFSTNLTFCFMDMDMDGKDELLIFSPYMGTCGFRIYDILETAQDIQPISITGEELDYARRFLIAPEEGFLLVWWRKGIYKYKILKNATGSISKLQELDYVCSCASDVFLSYTLEEPD